MRAVAGKASIGWILRQARGKAVLPLVVPVPPVRAVGPVHRLGNGHQRAQPDSRRSEGGSDGDFEVFHFRCSPWYFSVFRSEIVLWDAKHSRRYCCRRGAPTPACHPHSGLPASTPSTVGDTEYSARQMIRRSFHWTPSPTWAPTEVSTRARCMAADPHAGFLLGPSRTIDSGGSPAA